MESELTHCLNTPELVERIEIFTGSADPAEAHLYAQLPLTNEESKQNWQLAGRVLGPECAFSHTLPARVPMMNRSSTHTALLEAIVPDPCFWTPELPFLYRVQCELQTAGKTVAKCQRAVGVRRLGVRNGSVYFDGKRFVLRGVHQPLAPIAGQTEAAYCRETWTAIIISNPSDEFCDFASHHGVLLVADVAKQTAEEELTHQLRRLARWPAVAMAVVSGDATLPFDIQAVARNLLLAQAIAASTPLKLASWAQLAVVEVGAPQEFQNKIAGCTCPIIALRPNSAPVGIEAGRAACDALQRTLAPIGSFAGYLV